MQRDSFASILKDKPRLFQLYGVGAMTKIDGMAHARYIRTAVSVAPSRRDGTPRALHAGRRRRDPGRALLFWHHTARGTCWLPRNCRLNSGGSGESGFPTAAVGLWWNGRDG